MIKTLSIPKTAIILTMVIALCLGLASCGGSRYSTGTENRKSNDSVSNKSNKSNEEYEDPFERDLRERYEDIYEYPEPEQYLDPYWPTTNPELLAIPEEQRWYRAWDSVDTVCTIAGPVVDVFQAVNENGMPIFVSIGADYPDQNGVTLVIWADDEEAFDETLYAIDHGNAWISVTSYLGTYNGHLQFSSDNYVEWTYWTGVD